MLKVHSFFKLEKRYSKALFFFNCAASYRNLKKHLLASMAYHSNTFPVANRLFYHFLILRLFSPYPNKPWLLHVCRKPYGNRRNCS